MSAANATADEALLEFIVVSMFGTDPDLRLILPNPALSEDDDKKGTISLTVQAEQTGHTLHAVADYDLTITLSRTFRSDSHDLDGLWRSVLRVLRTPEAALVVYDRFSDLIIDDQEPTTSSTVDGNQLSRSLKVKCWFAPA